MDSDDEYYIQYSNKAEDGEEEDLQVEWVSESKPNAYYVSASKNLDGQDIDCYSPNFGVVLPFYDIKVHQEPLLWPFLVVEYYERYGKSGGRMTSRAVLPIFMFAEI